MKVFVSGSMSIDKLPDSAIKKIDSIIEKNCVILVGNASGVDLQVQKYLLKKRYDKVIVYGAGTEIRNNDGNWKMKEIAGEQKDIARAKDADYGLIIWDGLSIGTLNVIKELKNSNKGFCVVVDGTLYDEKNSDTVINALLNR